jgi:phosphoribosylanthranilate isomerase
VPTKIIQAINVKNEESIQEALEIKDLVDFIVLDTTKDKRSQVHDLNISKRITSLIPNKIILAGGLNPINIGAVIKKVQPTGVDVNSGLDRADGSKDLNLTKDFVNQAKAFSQEEI